MPLRKSANSRVPGAGRLRDNYASTVANLTAGFADTGPDFIQRDQPARRGVCPRQVPRCPTRPAPRVERPQLRQAKDGGEGKVSYGGSSEGLV